MPPPAPPVKLRDPCSAIFNGTLYVFSSDAFQSLPLESNTQWNELPMGTSVTGAQCVIGYPNGDPTQASFFVVGGSANSSEPDYPGLQRYSFQSKEWETISPVVPVTQNRQHHGAAYLNSSSSIVVFGGSQNGRKVFTSETFTISTQPPFRVKAYNSAAPPVINPIVLPWSDSRALVVGGDPSNTQAFTFGPDTAWKDVGVLLPRGLGDRNDIQCALVNGDDGSKVLNIFDMSVSPNTATGLVLLDSGGVVAPTGTFVGNSSQPSSRFKRQNTVADWPQYNDTLAPTVTRNGFSLAQSQDGLVVITGGTDEDPLCIFNDRTNGWINATSFLNAKSTEPNNLDLGGSTPSISPSSSASASASSSAAPTVGGSSDSSRNRTLKILGATLGGVFGLAALLIIMLLLIRWYRRNLDQGHKRKSSDFPDDKADRLSFQDRGLDFQPLTPAAQPMGSATRVADSTAILSGRDFSNGSQTPTKRTEINTASIRFNSTPSPLKGLTSPTLGEEVRMRDITKPADSQGPPTTKPARGDRLTDEGWSRYFQGNNASNLAHTSQGQSSYVSRDSRSDYRNSSYAHGSVEMPPLGFGRFSNGRQLYHVATGSPTTENPAANGRGTGLAVSEGLVGKISHADSASMESEDEDEKTAFSSGIPASIHDGDHLYTVPEPSQPRTASSVYTVSTYYPKPRDPRIEAEETAKFGFPLPKDIRATKPPAKDNGDSFPFPAPRPPPDEPDDYFGTKSNERQAKVNSDMSWLNLGGPSR